MPEEEVKDEIAEVVDQQGDTPQPAPGEPTEEPMLPKSRFDEVNTRMKEAEERAKLLEQQIEMTKLSQANAPQKPQQPKSIRRTVLEQLGLQDEEYLTVQQQIQVDEAVDYYRDQQIQQQQFFSTATDFDNIVGQKTQFGFQASDYLKEAIKNNPTLRGLEQMVAQNPAYASYAYAIAKTQKNLMELQAQSGKSEQEKLAIEKQQELINKTAPMSVAAAGSGGVTNTNQRVEKMNDQEFSNLLAQINRGEFD